MSEKVISQQQDKLSDLLTFTDNAAEKISVLIEAEKNDNLKLRIFIVGGRCAGLQYGLTFDEIVNPDDTLIEKQMGQQSEKSLSVVADPFSIQYLKGAIVDYKETEKGQFFNIRNPNVKTTCPCKSGGGE